MYYYGVIMSKNLDFVAQSHKDQNHISGQIWQTTIVMLIFIWNVVYKMQNNFFVLLARHLWEKGNMFIDKYAQ